MIENHESINVKEMPPALITFGGEARSGKGTSVDGLYTWLRSHEQNVTKIDQGLKFRVLADLALDGREALDDPSSITAFLCTDKTQNSMLRLLTEVSEMKPREVKEYLYRPAISAASARIGKVPASHHIATELLRAEVVQAGRDKKDTVIIDGRTMEKYARTYASEGLGRFVMGWYFRCSSATAARRSLGMFVDYDNMTMDEQSHLLHEILRIDERNRSDAMRETDKMKEPTKALRLDLGDVLTDKYQTPFAWGHAAKRNGMISVDTSHTRSVEEMLLPVLQISAYALRFSGQDIPEPALHPFVLPKAA